MDGGTGIAAAAIIVDRAFSTKQLRSTEHSALSLSWAGIEVN